MNRIMRNYHSHRERFSMENKIAKMLVVTLLVCCYVTLSAADVPFVLSWKSINSGAYCPNQAKKHLHWNEFYQIGFGVDSLAYKDLYATLELRSRANFYYNNVEIYNCDFVYNKSNWQIMAGSLPWGYGLPNALYTYALVAADQDQFSYQATRLNRVSLGHYFSNHLLSLAIGGNNHNQSIEVLTYQVIKPFGSLSISEEIRAQDNHWKTPVSISSINSQIDKGNIALNAQIAVSYLPKYENTEQHTTSYGLLAVNYKPNDLTELFLSTEYIEVEPSLNDEQRYHIGISRKIDDFFLNPFYYLDYYDNSSFHRAGLSLDYLFHKNQRVGLVYYLEGSKINKAKHNFAIQAQLGIKA